MTSKEWKNYKFSELVYILGGGTPKTTVSEYWNGTIPWLSVKDFNSGEKFVYTTEKTITQLGLEKSSTQLLKKNDIILSARGTVGEIAVIPFLMAFNQSCYGIRAKEEIINSDFLYYLLKNSINLLKHNTHGSVFDTITRETFDNIAIKLPPLETQQKIARVLSAIDDKIELNNSINNNLEQQIFTIFDNIFPNVRDGENTISNYFSPKRGKNLLSKNAILGDVPVIAGGLNPATYHNVANTNAPVITISASGANAGFVNLWHIPVWSSDSSYIDNTITSNIYFWYVMLKKRQQEIFDSQTGSAQPHIYPQHIEGMTVSDIDMNLVNDFNDNVTSLFINMGENIKENQKLIQLRDTLLPKLMNGEIDVSKV